MLVLARKQGEEVIIAGHALLVVEIIGAHGRHLITIDDEKYMLDNNVPVNVGHWGAIVAVGVRPSGLRLGFEFRKDVTIERSEIYQARMRTTGKSGVRGVRDSGQS